MEKQRALLQGMSSIGRLGTVQSSLAGERMMAVRKKSGKSGRTQCEEAGMHLPLVYYI